MRPAAVPVYANASASAYPQDGEAIRALLAEQLVRPVEFVRQIEAMYADGARVFLTVGPKGSHAGMIRQILEGKPHRAVACDDAEGGLGGLLTALGTLLAEGGSVDLDRLWAGRDCRVLDARLGGANRRPEPQPHMWWLNGSGAHRVGTTAREAAHAGGSHDKASGRTGRDRDPGTHKKARASAARSRFGREGRQRGGTLLYFGKASDGPE